MAPLALDPRFTLRLDVLREELHRLSPTPSTSTALPFGYNLFKKLLHSRAPTWSQMWELLSDCWPAVEDGGAIPVEDVVEGGVDVLIKLWEHPGVTRSLASGSAAENIAGEDWISSFTSAVKRKQREEERDATEHPEAAPSNARQGRNLNGRNQKDKVSGSSQYPDLSSYCTGRDASAPEPESKPSIRNGRRLSSALVPRNATPGPANVGRAKTTAHTSGSGDQRTARETSELTELEDEDEGPIARKDKGKGKRAQRAGYGADDDDEDNSSSDSDVVLVVQQPATGNKKGKKPVYAPGTVIMGLWTEFDHGEWFGVIVDRDTSKDAWWESLITGTPTPDSYPINSVPTRGYWAYVDTVKPFDPRLEYSVDERCDENDRGRFEVAQKIVKNPARFKKNPARFKKWLRTPTDYEVDLLADWNEEQEAKQKREGKRGHHVEHRRGIRVLDVDGARFENVISSLRSREMTSATASCVVLVA